LRLEKGQNKSGGLLEVKSHLMCDEWKAGARAKGLSINHALRRNRGISFSARDAPVSDRRLATFQSNTPL